MNLCDMLASQLGALFTCAPHDPYTRIRTPFLYPDGDVVDLFAREANGVVVVSDLGESLRWLNSQTVAQHRTQRQRQIIEDVCLNHSVELFRGMITARVKTGESLAAAVMRVGQAAVRVSDIWFTLRGRVVQTVTDEVADYFVERSVKFDRAEKLPGRSGRVWTVDFHVFEAQHGSLVNVLATGSRGAARGIVNAVVTAWHDLSHMHAQQLSFVSLFDDTLDVWAAEDFKLVEELSTVARWSRPDEFEQLLKAA